MTDPNPLIDQNDRYGTPPPAGDVGISETGPSSLWTRICRRIFPSFTNRSQQQAAQQQQFPPSGYLTLVPLSEATRTRQPRSARLTALYMISFALMIASVVYVLVPRTMSIGQVEVVTDQMRWNTTKAWYQVSLNVTIPVYNPNFLSTEISGRLKVLFYDALAGSKRIHKTNIRGRSLPSTITFNMDASDVPKDYILSIIGQCSTFPHALTFFLQGDVHAKGIWQFFGPTQVADIDTYFMVDCNVYGGEARKRQLRTAVDVMSRASIQQQQQRGFPQQQAFSLGGLTSGSHHLLLNTNGSSSRQTQQNGSKAHRNTESTQQFDDAADIFPSLNCESGDLGDMLAREMGDGGLGRESSQRFPAWGDASLSDMDAVPQFMPVALMNSAAARHGSQMANQHGGNGQHVVNGMPIINNNNNTSTMQPNLLVPSMVPSVQQFQMHQGNAMMQPVRDNNDSSNHFGYYCSKEQQQYPPGVPFPMQWYVNGPMMPYQCFATPVYFASQSPAGMAPSSDSDSGQGSHFGSKKSSAPQASSSSASKRIACVERYRKKKAKRSFKKHIRYQMRKDNADKRIRVKGRFARAST